MLQIQEHWNWLWVPSSSEGIGTLDSTDPGTLELAVGSSSEGIGTLDTTDPGTLELAVGSSSEGIGTLDTTDRGTLELGSSGNLELTTTTGTLRTLVYARLLLTE